MDFTGPAVLAWHANRSFAISADVEVRVTAVPGGWVAQVTATNADDRWALVELGSPFQLELEDGSVVDVGLGDPDDSGAFPVWEWEHDGDHRRPCPDCAGDLVRTGTEIVPGTGEAVLRDACSACGRDVVRSVSLPT